MASIRTSPLMMLLGAIAFFSAQAFAASAVLGVDLGTEYIKAALVKPGIPLEIVLTKDSRRKETSAVAFKPSQGGPKQGQYPERLYGADAMSLAPRFPSDVYPNLKTVLGLPIDDSIVQDYAARHPGLQLEGHSTRNTAAFKSKSFTAEEEAWMVEELLAMELQSIQKNAELTAGDGTLVRSIVLTVPPFYTIDEKRAVQTAAELAGLKVLSLISDGLAVGLNYATSRQFPNINEGAKPEYHLIFDMGAGSTKATVMKFQGRSVKDVGKFNKTVQEIQVLGTGWDHTLGGDALNYLILDDMVSQFVDSKGAKKASVTSQGVRGHGRAMAKLSNQVEKVRHILSANQNTGASFEGLYEDVDFKYKITRAEFETMAESHAERVAVAINAALKMSGLEIADLESVILHGGASRTPFVQKALEQIVGSPDKIRSNVNSDEAAVFGAAFRAAQLSPSFRVKEIRIQEGAGYPAGLKWTTSKDKTQRQRLWTPISPHGGDPKEVTFVEREDFTVTFYQQIASDEKDVQSFATKNLTSTIAAMKEKYPSCVESDIQFKVGVKLSSENGEVEVVKAAVECEVEVSEKEGFVDGVKNLFGFGKKDQQPLKGENEKSESAQQAPSEEPNKSSTSSATGSESTTVSSDNTEATEAAKKKEIVSIPVEMVSEKLGLPELSKAEVVKSKDRLKAFAASDKARFQREEALNQLEGYTYRIRDLLDGEAFIEMSTEQERTKLVDLSSETGEWLYGDGTDATKEELKAKLKQLQDIVVPIQKRVEEAEVRPALVTELKNALNQTSNFVDTIRKQIDEFEAFHYSSSVSASASSSIESSSSTKAPSETPSEFDGLEDDATTTRKMEDVVEEKGPVPPMYKREDLDGLEKLHKSTLDWLNEMEDKQSGLPVTSDPVLTVKDLKSKREKLDKAGMDLALKGVKDFEEMQKKLKKAKKAAEKAEKAEKRKAQESKSAGAGANTEDAAEDGKPPMRKVDLGNGVFVDIPADEKMTDEEIQRILKQATDSQGQGQEKQGEESPHDEL